MNETTSSTSVPKTYFVYVEPDPFLKSMGMLVDHVAVAGVIIVVLIGLLVLSHTVYIRFFKKKE